MADLDNVALRCAQRLHRTARKATDTDGELRKVTIGASMLNLAPLLRLYPDTAVEDVNAILAEHGLPLRLVAPS